jgi:hypothetical protein
MNIISNRIMPMIEGRKENTDESRLEIIHGTGGYDYSGLHPHERPFPELSPLSPPLSLYLLYSPDDEKERQNFCVSFFALFLWTNSETEGKNVFQFSFFALLHPLVQLTFQN